MLVPFSIWEFSTGATLKFDFLSMTTLGYNVIIFFDACLFILQPRPGR